MILPIGDPQAAPTPAPVAMPNAELFGRVISVRGSQASVGLPPTSPQSPEEARATVGKFLGVRAGKSLLVGLIADVSLRTEPLLRDREQVAVAQVDLIGEIRDNDSAAACFQRGVTSYPAIGDPVSVIGSRELRMIFQNPGSRMIEVGQLQQDATIPARLDVDEMLSKHFAVLGTTGVGKSSAVDASAESDSDRTARSARAVARRAQRI